MLENIDTIKSDQLQLGRYIHYKNAQYYEVIGIARHSETLEEMIIYKALYHSNEFGENAIWVRPKKMFFETVQHLGEMVSRFTYVGDIA